MSDRIKYLRHNVQNAVLWSGGETTELAIYPAESNYAARNFDWRISTAVVRQEFSTFTALPGFKRHLMLLDGEIELTHEGQHRISLIPFRKDTFEGSWKTTSKGTGTDFNLMLGTGWEGNIDSIHLESSQKLEVAYSNTEHYIEHFYGVYCYRGNIGLKLEDDRIVNLNEKDFAIIELNKEEQILVNAYSKSDIISVDIMKKNT